MTAWDDDLPDLAAGDRFTDTAVISKIMGVLHALTDELEPFSLTWTSTGTAPDIDDGTQQGYYTRFRKNGFIIARLHWAAGTSGGTGAWSLGGLPDLLAYDAFPLLALARDNSAGKNYYGGARYLGGSTSLHRLHFSTDTGTLGEATATHPYTWAADDILTVVGFVPFF